MLKKLETLGPPESLPIAIERPNGLIVDALVDAGHVVVPIHPNVIKACRPRYHAAPGKSDPGDAYILADVLRTDGHRFRKLSPHSDELRALRALVRSRDALLAERIALVNQLQALLESFWPGATRVFCRLDTQISLAFLERYPTPSSALRLGPKRMAQFLKRQSYCGGRAPEQLLERLRSAPEGLVGPLEEKAKGTLVHIYIKSIGTLLKQLRQLQVQIGEAVGQFAFGRILMSFPRLREVNAAQILAELGENPTRFATEAQLAAEAGVAPVTLESGQRRTVSFRFACNKRLRKALTCFAQNSRFDSPWAARIYTKARQRGCRHPHAVRILARAWVRVIWRAWQDGTAYNPKKHGTHPSPA